MPKSERGSCNCYVTPRVKERISELGIALVNFGVLKLK
jgi:hypothetical protein